MPSWDLSLLQCALQTENSFFEYAAQLQPVSEYRPRGLIDGVMRADRPSGTFLVVYNSLTELKADLQQLSDDVKHKRFFPPANRRLLLALVPAAKTAAHIRNSGAFAVQTDLEEQQGKGKGPPPQKRKLSQPASSQGPSISKSDTSGKVDHGLHLYIGTDPLPSIRNKGKAGRSDQDRWRSEVPVAVKPGNSSTSYEWPGTVLLRHAAEAPETRPCLGILCLRESTLTTTTKKSVMHHAQTIDRENVHRSSEDLRKATLQPFDFTFCRQQKPEAIDVFSRVAVQFDGDIPCPQDLEQAAPSGYSRRDWLRHVTSKSDLSDDSGDSGVLEQQDEGMQARKQMQGDFSARARDMARAARVIFGEKLGEMRNKAGEDACKDPQVSRFHYLLAEEWCAEVPGLWDFCMEMRRAVNETHPSASPAAVPGDDSVILQQMGKQWFFQTIVPVLRNATGILAPDLWAQDSTHRS